MKKKIAILGSTGSIGKTLLNIVNHDKKKFEIKLLTANETDEIGEINITIQCDKWDKN